MPFTLEPGALTAFVSVVLIDLALAGDNAVAVGMAASGLPARQRRRAIALGMAGAAAMLIVFAVITTQLLKIVGLTVAGGFLLLWVCWKMWRELRAQGHEPEAEGEAAAEEAAHQHVDAQPRARPKGKTLTQAMTQILITDMVMSLDNVLAVAGAARGHLVVLAAGLLLSVTMTAFAANWIAKLLHRFRWIGYLGLVVVIYVAGHMIWDGVRTVAIQTDNTELYNAYMPGLHFDIKPSEIERRMGGR